jgi:hypothetical protein
MTGRFTPGLPDAVCFGAFASPLALQAGRTGIEPVDVEAVNLGDTGFRHGQDLHLAEPVRVAVPAAVDASAAVTTNSPPTSPGHRACAAFDQLVMAI